MRIASRFNGPPGSGNGGWCCGRFAGLVDAPAEVTLRKPPPLETDLTAAGDEVRDPDGELVASVRSVPAFGFGGAPVAWADAVEAAKSYAGFAEHPFPSCYVCGPERTDGLRIFPGPVAGGVAAPAVVPPDVTPETVWAMLDCPGGWSVIGAGRPYVLGRMAAIVDALPTPGDECVVVGHCGDRQGRKASVRSALFAPGGALLAHARATWIAV